MTINMKQNKFKILVLLAIFFICFSLSSCSMSFLGTYYFKIDGITYQTINFDIFNNATLTTMVYENSELVAENKLKGKWQRLTQVKKDSENSTIRDESGQIIYSNSVYFTYYDSNVKKSVQFFYENNTLIDAFYNKDYETYREFRR